MNAALKVCIACSAAFTRWLWGSTTCNLQSFLVRNFLMCLVAWLSMIFNFGLNPFCSNSIKYALYALNMLMASNPAMGMARMAFDL